MDPTRTTDGEAATGELLTAAVGDRCTNCQAPFAPDQHYCVNCGERRGKPRFSLAAMTTPAAAQPSTTPSSRASRRPRASAGFTLIAGVGTLLLAMGVGVLIGRNGNTTTQRASTPPVQVVSVNGGGTAAPAQSSSGSGGGSPKAKQGRVVHISKKVTAAASAAASKVLGASAKNLPPPTVTVGQAGHGAGYQNGHFTGNFFGQ